MTAAVRRARREDAQQIADITAEVTAEPHPVALPEPLSAPAVRAWIERQGEQGALFVVVDGRHVLAFAAVDADAAQPEQCSFGAWVRARSRRQGHGTALAEEALAFARAGGYRRIRARLPERNEPALSFLSSISVLAALTAPGTSFELPVPEERR